MISVPASYAQVVQSLHIPHCAASSWRPKKVTESLRAPRVKLHSFSVHLFGLDAVTHLCKRERERESCEFLLS